MLLEDLVSAQDKLIEDLNAAVENFKATAPEASLDSAMLEFNYTTEGVAVQKFTTSVRASVEGAEIVRRK
jgi:hypothetical protein